MKIVIDTSVFIDFSRARVGLFKELITKSKENVDLYTPTVVMLEFWAGEDMNNKTNIKNAEKLFEKIIKIPLDEDIAKRAGELMRAKEVFGFDSIVAATALRIGAQVATSNTKHFSKIKNLKFYSK